MDNDNGALVTQQFGALSTEHGSPVGIKFAQGELPFEEWKDRVASLAKIRTFSPFAVGDVFGYGVAHYSEKKAMSDTLIKLADHAAPYVRKCADVCSKVPYDSRRLGLSFEHHAAVSRVKGNGCEAHAGSPNPLSAPNCSDCEVARLAEIANWLEMAEKKKWSA